MTITRERKEELVATYTEMIAHSDGFVLAEYNRLPTPKVNALRDKLRPIGGKFVIAKNTLFGLALRQAGWPVPEDMLKRPTAVVFGQGNFPAIAKEALAFFGDKDNTELISVKGGVMIASILKAKDVETISTLPSLDELRAQLAGLLTTPASLLLGVLDAATGQVVNVLHAYVNKDGEAA